MLAQFPNDDEVAVCSVHWDDDQLVFGFDEFDAQIRAVTSDDGRRLDGIWKRRMGDEQWSRLPFSARAGSAESFRRKVPPAADVSGKWKARISILDASSVLILRQEEGGTVVARFLNPTGPYFMQGILDGKELRLAGFNGPSGFLVEGHLDDDGHLAGRFWEADLYETEWEAVRDPDATLDSFTRLVATQPVPMQTQLLQLDGCPIDLETLLGEGKVLLIDVMGTWCPACHPLSVYLTRLLEKYQEQGLRVVGVAFEVTNDFARNTRQVSLYVEKYAIPYDILLASREIQFPRSVFVGIEGGFGFPSLIALARDGTVLFTHTGFVAPSIKDQHRAQCSEIENRVRKSLTE